ncbi:MAG: hypothetical protein PHG85_05850 [Candidatus Altiarchaeota archaeon]|nr:hypothetical protein [Candidatus Altiarchaeota archaeon]
MGRAQASIEFMVVLSLVVLILVMMSIFLYQKFVRGDELKIFMHGSRIVSMLADNVNEINTVGDGYSKYITLPETLYGSREYTVRFYQNEPTIYIKGGSFLKGITVTWSAPVSTIKVGCLVTECNQDCNKTPADFCMNVNGSMELRATNDRGMVFLTYPYNIRQGDGKEYIIPVRGNFTYDNESCERGSFMYIYRNTEDGTDNLVFQHNSSTGGDRFWIDFYDIIGELNVTTSDDENELTLTPFQQARWNLRADECSGGVITFKEGIHMCFAPVNLVNELNWTWLNGDGSIIWLNKSQDLCLSYP